MMKRALRLFGGLAAVPLLYLLAAVIGALLPGERAEISGGSDVTIGLISGPIHYDFLLPLNAQTRRDFAFLEAAGVPIRHPNAEWLIVGWGAEQFYTTVGSYADVTFQATWKGITGDSSVLRADVAGALTAQADIQMLGLGQGQYAALVAGILSSFAPKDRGAVVLQRWTPGVSAAFLKGADRFHIFRTCNQWLGGQLRNAGVSLGAWTPIPASVSLSLYWFGHDR